MKLSWTGIKTAVTGCLVCCFFAATFGCLVALSIWAFVSEKGLDSRLTALGRIPEIFADSYDDPNAGKRYQKRHKTLRTDSRFHKLVLKPGYLALPFPGYLIGIEGNINSLFVSHIGKFQPSINDNRSWTTCFIYNAYYSGIRDCDGGTSAKNSQNDSKPEDIGFAPVIKLKPELEKAIENKGITHVIVYSTGFNTPQWESLANYSDLHRNLIVAARPDSWLERLWGKGKDFTPLFIGLSWRSFEFEITENKFGQNLKNIDYAVIGPRADKIGEELAKSLREMVLFPIKQKFGTKIVFVGHSLGARILSQAAYYSDGEGANSSDQQKIDLLVGLQGAFPAERYVPDRDQYFYADHDKFVAAAIYTVSKNDKAVEHPFRYIGSEKARKHALDNFGSYFSFSFLGDDGRIAQKEFCDKGNKPVLVNAENVIRHNIPGTGGDAHSDIYSMKIGRFLWQVIRDCTVERESAVR